MFYSTLLFTVYIQHVDPDKKIRSGTGDASGEISPALGIEEAAEQGWEFALCFFLYESLIFLEQKCDVLFSKCESCWSLFLMSDGSECCLLQRARRAMKSNLLFCFENKKV